MCLRSFLMMAISNDDRIRFHQAEKQALYDAGLAAFILTSMNMKGEEKAEAFRQALPKMKRLLKKEPRPFIATVSRAGEVILKKDWLKDIVPSLLDED